MSVDGVGSIRTRLDEQFGRIEALIKSLKYQEAADRLSAAKEAFEQLEAIVDFQNEVQKRIVENRRTRMDRVFRNIEEGLRRREAGKKEDGNLAFKCNWNDKGYKGVCSDAAYDYNVHMGRPWCTGSSCRECVGVEPVPKDCCYEARALLDCYFAAGWDQESGRLIRPRKIWSARRGKIALLTTELPHYGERLLVGAFLITKLVDDPEKETEVYGDKDTALDDMLEYRIRFWDYHKNPTNLVSTAWATGLFRYVSNTAVSGILEEYISKKREKGGDTSKAEGLVGALKHTVRRSGSR